MSRGKIYTPSILIGVEIKRSEGTEVKSVNTLACSILLLVVALECDAPAANQSDSRMERRVRQYLKHHFDDYLDSEDGTRTVYGLAYNEKAALEPVVFAELKDLLPNTRFFRTTVDTPSQSYPTVPAIISVSRVETRHDIRVCLSLDYIGPSRKFLEQFQHTTTVSDIHRAQLVTGLGKLLASITRDSRLIHERMSDNEAAIRLWISDHCWRRVLIKFNSKNAAESITITPCPDKNH